MPAKPDDDRDRTAFPELHTQSQPPSTVATGKQPPSPLSTWIGEFPVTQFRFRILVVDDEPAMRELAQRKLESKKYEFSQQRTVWLAYTRSASLCLT